MKNYLNHNLFLKDEEFHASVFRKYFDSLYSYGLKISGDSELVKDCIQDLFFRIWKNKIDINSVRFLKAYLLRSLRNQIFNLLKLKSNQIDKGEIDELNHLEFSPEDYYIQNQNEENLRNKILIALNQLPVKQREAIYLKYFENLSFDELATVMNINVQSAKNNVQRGLKSLKNILSLYAYLYLINLPNSDLFLKN